MSNSIFNRISSSISNAGDTVQGALSNSGNKVSNFFNDTVDKVSNLTSTIPGASAPIAANVQNVNPAQNISESGAGNALKKLFSFPSFSSNKYLTGTKDFLNSNSFVAKLSFLLLVIILFVFLMRIGISILSWFLAPSKDPILVNGMANAKQMIRIPQDPSISGAKPVMRSNNDPNGLEFTWSVWINVEDFTYKQNQYKHIFHKGNDDIIQEGDDIGINFPNNAPGLYITPNINNLLIKMNTFEEINEDIIVNDLPLNKWVNVMIRVIQNQLDVFINGSLVKRHMLKGVPKQNYGDVFVTMNGGFSGFLSELRYFDYAIGTNQIQRLISSGPNLKYNSPDFTKGKPQYLSTRWFLNNSVNAF